MDGGSARARRTEIEDGLKLSKPGWAREEEAFFSSSPTESTVDCANKSHLKHPRRQGKEEMGKVHLARSILRQCGCGSTGWLEFFRRGKAAPGTTYCK